MVATWHVGHRAKKIEGWKADTPRQRLLEALAVMEQQRPTSADDMLMPEMAGWSWSGVFAPSNPLVQVILMTAHGSETRRSRHCRKGAPVTCPRRACPRSDRNRRAGHVRPALAVRSQQRIHDSLQAWNRSSCWKTTSPDPAAVQYLEESVHA